MLKIDRMVLDDVGGNPAKLAAAVIQQIQGLEFRVPVREIAEAVDIYEIKEGSLTNLEGALITDGDKSAGSILINKDRPETRRRYTIGHELGHYLNPYRRPTAADGFRCSSKDMVVEAFSQGDRAAQMEVEANEFSAELLMPPQLVRKFLRQRRGIDIEHIVAMADTFEVSREAASRRYVLAQDEPAAVVFSKQGVIRYPKKHPKFPALSAWSGQPLPQHCESGKSALPEGRVSDWATLDAGIWLKDPKGRRVCEQTMAQRDGFRLTLLTLEEAEEDEPDDEWEAPRFRR